jgi:hypothetical protein
MNHQKTFVCDEKLQKLTIVLSELNVDSVHVPSNLS